MDLTTGGIVAWLAVGLVAGWAAGKVSRGHAVGLIGDLAVALIGSLLGGLMGKLLVQSPSTTGSVVTAFIGAVILLGLLRLFGARRMAV